MRKFAQIRNARVFAFPLRQSSSLDGRAGSTSNCRTAVDWAMKLLMAARNQLLGMAAKDPRLVRVRPSGWMMWPSIESMWIGRRQAHWGSH